MSSFIGRSAIINRLRLSNVVQLKCHIFILFGSFATVLPHTSVEANQIGIAAPLVGIMMAVVPFCTVLATASLPYLGATIKRLKYAIIVTLVGQSTCHLLTTRCSSSQGSRSAVTFQPRCSTGNTSLYACLNDRMTKYFKDLCWADDSMNPYNSITILSCVLKCGCFCEEMSWQCLIKDSRNVRCNDIYCQRFDVSKFLFFCDYQRAPSCKLSCSRRPKLDSDGTDWSTEGMSIFRDEFWIHAAQRSETWCFLTLRLVGFIFSGMAITLTSTTTALILADANDQSDTQRIWGSAGWGILSVLTGQINHIASTEESLIVFTPGVILMASMSLLDILIILLLRIPKKEIKPQHLFLGVISVYSKVRTHFYMTLCFVMGSLSGAIWVFGPLRLRLVGADVTALAAVAAAQSLGGELVHWYVSDRLIQYMGVGNAVNASIFGMFVRLMSYSFFPWPRYILAFEIAQGLTMGLFIRGSAHLASMAFDEDVAGQLQQTLYTMYHGVGACFGALVAGCLFNLLEPARTYVVCSIAALLAFYAHFVATQCFIIKTGLGSGSLFDSGTDYRMITVLTCSSLFLGALITFLVFVEKALKEGTWSRKRELKTGSCSDSNEQRFLAYYDYELNLCNSFVGDLRYCLTGDNRFETREDCVKACIKPGFQKHRCNNHGVGLCQGPTDKLYNFVFNKGCHVFKSVLCLQGNNKFISLDECQSYCCPNCRSEYCSAHVSEGRCLTSDLRFKFYYDANNSQCLPHRGTCLKGRNRYRTLETCASHFPLKSESRLRCVRTPGF
ncbi:unnamed protein product [Ixodes hexagonus]